jgi:predicted dehydrogenase
MAKRINVGVIGVGEVTISRHIPSVKEVGDADARIYALADIVPGRAKAIAEANGIPVYTEDYRELLRSPDIDAISICTRIDSHKQITIEALEAGKHVYLEKPATVNAQEMEDIMAVARKSDALLLVGSNGLLQSQMMLFKDMIDHGDLGEMFMVSVERAHNRKNNYVPGSVKGQESGISKHSASHNIEWALFFLGDPKPVSVLCQPYFRHGSISNPGPRENEKDDCCLMLVQFEGGYSFSYKAMRAAVASEEYMLKLYGDMGTIEYDIQKCYKAKSDDCVRIFRDVPELGIQESKPLMTTGKTHADMYRHFFDCIRSGKQSISNGERALTVMKVLDAVDESIRQGGKQVNID